MNKKIPDTVRDIMSRDCYRVSRETSITTLAQGLALHRLPGAPVVDTADRLIGFISEQDVLGHVLDSIYHDHEAPLVRELMRQDVLTTSPNKSVTDLAQEMLGAKPKIYPVVEQHRLVGIVTRRDILMALLMIRRH
ncbi:MULTISPECIES: CBS domain-containing protein [Halomonadaceae]|jgi:CBS-domain-containing membrane protein|uniref:CBS domain-containing protein n=1 Tax=Vreelandella aquamarina TaxID=77097 RepID=A0A0D7UZM9_9GAMM|nr:MULTISPECIES: CBS domain-containing protein [Halomonas]KTG24848.1 histidine kinase [Idiomarina sp. H105]MEC9294651.1 CBS domain-containing protein [Pseudomonadota bacterium]OAE94329.1 histidine kinase [Idiomarina sp. WRN-38]KJD18922.1 histidine kinase [Halomonas meridiana]MBV65025.1 CBS domain-containing protein [Halomonas sp.]|tara:strand:+ start:500 stop:907 length:408 start_codon:yes stop_codon:yes gene_type:complete